jgi:hypothetical protein
MFTFSLMRSALFLSKNVVIIFSEDCRSWRSSFCHFLPTSCYALWSPNILLGISSRAPIICIAGLRNLRHACLKLHAERFPCHASLAAAPTIFFLISFALSASLYCEVYECMYTCVTT